MLWSKKLSCSFFVFFFTHFCSLERTRIYVFATGFTAAHRCTIIFKNFCLQRNTKSANHSSIFVFCLNDIEKVETTAAFMSQLHIRTLKFETVIDFVIVS